MEAQLAERLAYSPADAAKAAGIGRTTLFAEIRDNRLQARKQGRRTIILRDDLQAWLLGLPTVNAGHNATP